MYNIALFHFLNPISTMSFITGVTHGLCGLADVAIRLGTSATSDAIRLAVTPNPVGLIKQTLGWWRLARTDK